MTKSKIRSNLMPELYADASGQIILADISVTTATPELPTPLLTASGAVKNTSLVLVKITSKCGTEGHSYLFSPNAKLLPALASAVSVAFDEVKGRSCSPEPNTDYLLDKFLRNACESPMDASFWLVRISASDTSATTRDVLCCY